MSGLAHCPHCDLQWSVPKENAGRPVACPVCARVLEAEEFPPPDPGPDRSDGPRPEEQGPPGLDAREDRITRQASSSIHVPPSEPGPPSPPLAPRAPAGPENPGPAPAPGEVPVVRKAAVRISRRLPVERVNWLKLGSSLNCVYQGLCLALLAGPVFFLILFIAQPLLGLTVVGTALLVLDVILLALIDLGALGFTIVGFVGCLGSPSRHGARALAVANLYLFGFTILVALAAIPLVFLGAGFLLSLLVGPLYLGWLFVFLFYLRAVALNQNAQGRAASLLKLAIAVGATLAAEPLFLAAGSMLASAVGPTAGSVLLLSLYACCGGWLFALCGWFLSDLVSLLADIERNPDESGRRGWMTLLGANAVIFVVWLILSGVGAPWAVAMQQQALAPVKKSWAARRAWNWGQGTETPGEDARTSSPPDPASGPANPPPVPRPPPTSPIPVGDRISVENFRRIKFGMDEAQVLGVLGRPTRTEITTRPGLGDRGEVKALYWEGANRRITVLLSGGTVAATVGLELE